MFSLLSVIPILSSAQIDSLQPAVTTLSSASNATASSEGRIIPQSDRIEARTLEDCSACFRADRVEWQTTRQVHENYSHLAGNLAGRQATSFSFRACWTSSELCRTRSNFIILY